ncbi:BAI1-associated protein 3-like isoform X2 [Clytia hemisphaerica]|uniref:BAI1-associated protein 3-like isoform X2 n=1 Tax=Clytia hemisphaerica TaxID=252671 RepID=UPI0034D6F6D8
MDYGHLVFNQLKDKGFYDDVGQFDVTDELCIMMNNTAHVLQFLDYVPKAAQFDQYLDAMRLTEREKDVERSSQTLHNILNCAKEDMRNKLDQIILHVGKRMKESLKDYILKIITNNQKTVDESCDDLLEYIENNLTTLSSSLLSQVFERILDHMWKAVLECMTDLTKKKLLQRHYKKLQELLQIVFDFFHGDGNGLSVEALQGALHQELTYCLQLNSSSTEELIENYFVDQCEQQKAADSSLGKTAFKVFFDNLTKKLNVYVLNAANILPLDSSGKSDPYIKLSVQPQHLFPQVKPQKTKFQKETLYPLFDESFQLIAYKHLERGFPHYRIAYGHDAK